MDAKTSAKKKVLEEIMSLMDEESSEALKAKSPKFSKMEIPKDEKSEDMSAVETEEKPEMPATDDMSDEDRERLKELYEKHCK